MGLWDGVFAGGVRDDMDRFIGPLIEKFGGLQGLVAEFDRHGMRDLAYSWVGTGLNRAITPEQVHHVLGATVVAELASQGGLSTREMTAKLATLLPRRSMP